MDIRQLQQRLRELRYDVDVTGVEDEKTRWAVRWFEKKNGSLEALYAPDAIPGVREGETVYYSMKNEIWSKHPYKAANTETIEYIEDSGCGPMSMSMALSNLLRVAILPPTAADWSNAHGYRDPNGVDGTDDAFFIAYAPLFGCRATLIKTETEEDYMRVFEGIRNGAVAICNVVPGSPYTTCGHYNLITALVDGKVVISDPVPKNNDLPRYPLEQWVREKYARHCILIEKEAQ